MLRPSRILWKTALATLVTLAGATHGLAPFVHAQDKPANPLAKVPTQWAHVELKGGYPEGASMPGLFGAASETMSTIMGRLEQAGNDQNLGGIVLRINSPSLGWAKVNEFRTAISAVREKGKKVYAVLDDANTQGYMLASACDQIIMPESGSVMMLGLRAEVTFYKNLFDLVGVKADMMQVGEYKGAAEPYARTEMSPAFREEMEAVIGDYYDQIVDTVAKDRKLPREKVIEIIDNGPHTAKAARELGLIDKLAYEDEVKELVKRQPGGDKLATKYGKKKIDTDFSGFGGMVKMMNLMMGVEPKKAKGKDPVIAIVHVTGVIMPGKSAADMFGGEMVGSDSIIEAIQKADGDSQVKAIVLRVDSPGGSALASDLMWRSIKQCNKPIVASMGDTAASGGYYVSMGCDAIFAEPGTLTGSIGVVGGKIALGGLYNKVGITTSVISRGKNSGAMSELAPFSDTERAAMQKLMADIYDQFTAKAAESRKMPQAELEKLARGRVYTGQQALKLKLIDKLGTLDDAVAHAKQLAGLKAEDKVDRMMLPKAANPFESLLGPIDLDEARAPVPSATAEAFGAALRQISPQLAKDVGALSVMQLLNTERRLTVLPFRITVE